MSDHYAIITASHKYLIYPQISLFYALCNDPSPISYTRTSCLKLDNAEYKDILENFKERLSEN